MNELLKFMAAGPYNAAAGVAALALLLGLAVVALLIIVPGLASAIFRSKLAIVNSRDQFESAYLSAVKQLRQLGPGNADWSATPGGSDYILPIDCLSWNLAPTEFLEFLEEHTRAANRVNLPLVLVFYRSGQPSRELSARIYSWVADRVAANGLWVEFWFSADPEHELLDLRVAIGAAISEGLQRSGKTATNVRVGEVRR